MVRTLIHSAHMVSHGAATPDAWVLFDGDVTAARGTGATWRDAGLVDLDVIDADGRWLTPGFIDIHCHGGNGGAFDDTQGIGTGLDFHRRHGTTRSAVSLVTATLPDLETRLIAIADTAERDPLVLGAHLEGPFLDAHYRGAHDELLLRAPDADSTERLLEAGRGHLLQVTLAPELPGAADAISRFLRAGVTVAVGHTAADYETACAAFDSGASILTHAFNGMKGIHHRAPGPVLAALQHPGVTLELINDGVHVYPQVARLAFSEAPGRVALITDAMAAAGAGDGSYRLGTLSVSVADGVARLAGRDGAIAGSTATMDEALRRAVNEVGLSMVEAVSAATDVPARAIGRGHDLGRLDVGYAADAVLLNRDLAVEAVIAAGRRLL